MSKPKADMHFDGGIGPHASIEPAKFFEIAKQHVSAAGGVGEVVDERKTRQQWRAWLAYFDWLDGQTWPRGRKAATARSMRNGVTVPTAWPYQFDLSAPSTPMLYPELDEANPTRQRRRELADILSQAVAGLAAPAARTPPLDARYAAWHETRLAGLAEAPLPQMSDELIDRYFGRKPGQTAAWRAAGDAARQAEDVSHLFD